MKDDADFNVIPCAGASGCYCAQACNFARPDEGCNADERCAFAGETSPLAGHGLCLRKTGGSTVQNAACTLSFDARGNPTSDSCELGLYCRGAVAPNDNAGSCVRICPTQGPDVCAALGSYTCVPLFQGSVSGDCLSAPPRITDMNEACTSNDTCEGAICLDTSVSTAAPTKSCSSSCRGTAQCPTSAACEGNVCVLRCTPGAAGNQTCASSNPGSACHAIAPNEGLCLGKCRTNADCQNIFGGGTCQVATGSCS